MATNSEREILKVRGSILRLEGLLASTTRANGHGGWRQATPGELSDLRAQLDAARRKLGRYLSTLPPEGLASLKRILDNDPVPDLDLAGLQRQAARAGATPEH